jgi:hypothetical protein
MHKFYLTNNLGGGGTNVSRLYDYLELFNLDNIGILLNYYYLTGQSDPAFDRPLIEQIRNQGDIHHFVSYCRTYFNDYRNTSNAFNSISSDNNINGFILDNGCGNFLRNLLQAEQSHNSLRNLVKPFLDFAESLHFDLSVALDMAMKYTYKANEVNNSSFMNKWKEVADDNQINLELLSDALELKKKNKYKHKILAPLHGYDYQSFSSYYEKVVGLEKKLGAKFSGFALGGIANTRMLDKNLWGIPTGFTQNLKSAYLCYKLIRTIRKKTTRHIHVLGAGNIYTLPFLIHAGANSSDCHSAWRRSSDGGINKAKIVVPLMDKDFNFINEKDCLEYVKIGDLQDEQYTFNNGYKVSQIKNLLKSNYKEDFYFGEILIFYEAILQYNILINFINKHPNNYLELLSKSLDSKLNDNYKRIITTLGIW